MFKATLDRRKTQTRRPVKDQNGYHVRRYTHSWGEDYSYWYIHKGGCGSYEPRISPKYNVGDLLGCICATWYVRIFRKVPFLWPLIWQLFVVMCVEITNVRAERVKNISDEDCWSEGINDDDFAEAEHYSIAGSPLQGGSPERCAFIGLWDSIYGQTEYASENNPYVWVYEFRRVDQ